MQPVRLASFVTLLVALAVPAVADTVHVAYAVPPGTGTMFLDVAPATGPLENVTFNLGGAPHIKITRIVGGTNHDPDLVIADATPHAVTQYFAQNPIRSTESTQFYVVFDNTATNDRPLSVTMRFD